MSKRYVTMDGNEAAAHMAYPFTEIAAIYPITPSSPMAGLTDAWSAKGRKNIFGQTVALTEMQSEAGAITAVHGALQTGSLATTYTSSQGLMLMVPVLYRIAGEKLPAVLHVASRTVGTHGMSIFGDHSDVMACRQTGFAMLSSGSVQEVADLAPVAHLAAVKGRIPFMHFFDGFRTSHEINKIEIPDQDALAALLDQDALKAFRDSALNPEHPTLRNTVQNGDVYFQLREANNVFYDALPDIVEEYLAKVSEITGREYHVFNYYGAPDATDVVVAMGSASGVIRDAVDALNKEGRKTGFLQVHLYRPFSAKYFLDTLPDTVERIAVLDRCKAMGSAGEPLFEDVCSVLMNSERQIKVVGGRYGLSSKDTDPAQMVAVFDNLASPKPVRSFTIGINDDVTHLSLPLKPFTEEKGSMIRCKFWGLGGDGTVGANHNTVRIINNNTDKFAQAYFEYDAKKSFGVTKSHLRFSDDPITSSYYVKQADFVACHNQSYVSQYDIVDEIVNGGTFLLNCSWNQEELESHIPADVRRKIVEKNIQFYMIDANKIAQELGLGSHTNTVLQASFFALMQVIPTEEALDMIKAATRKSYFTKGDEVIAKNIAAIDAGAEKLVKVEVPASWADAKAEEATEEKDVPEVVKRLLEPINKQKGDDLPVSAFKDYEDGHIDMGLTAFEKRGIALKVPVWDASKCIQCNRCALVCPHAVIRPYLLNDDEKANAPESYKTIPATGAAKGLHFTMQISTYDCTGCGSCVSCCPAKEKAITMEPVSLCEQQKIDWEYGLSLSDKGDLFNVYTIKGSQFRQPLIEFSAACAGCGETPYAKLLTQLFGDRVYWANATGCSQAWGSPMPGIPYTTNKRGHGPAWTNSLFENNAELALGMFLSVKQQRLAQKKLVESYAAETESAAAKNWLEGFDDFDGSRELTDALVEELMKVGSENKEACEDADKASDVIETAKKILERKDQLSKKCFWMFGGDGWAYDIGFGGLDHVVASGEDINVFVVDTEVYSNTGGQSSKATPLGAVAQFASAGKRSRKKDLGAIFQTYGNVYVAQVAMGADPNQLIKALHEAEQHKGPSVIVAYTPCVAHGIKAGMANVQQEMKRAVDAGYWTLYRYNPNEEKPMKVDSKAPTLDYEEFLDGETRYAALKRTFPDHAEELFKAAKEDAAVKYQKYKNLEEL
ncbi:MAG: pyruvate:ferredoxin (flavodoxin) oxidoreductase [Lachnospiraceae bacterium]|nr:pyruvate:ferredoxin (flavodoxin) oxidoreductase [Lachnospiraceae bacterium]